MDHSKEDGDRAARLAALLVAEERAWEVVRARANEVFADVAAGELTLSSALLAVATAAVDQLGGLFLAERELVASGLDDAATVELRERHSEALVEAWALHWSATFERWGLNASPDAMVILAATFCASVDEYVAQHQSGRSPECAEIIARIVMWEIVALDADNAIGFALIAAMYTALAEDAAYEQLVRVGVELLSEVVDAADMAAVSGAVDEIGARRANLPPRLAARVAEWAGANAAGWRAVMVRAGRLLAEATAGRRRLSATIDLIAADAVTRLSASVAELHRLIGDGAHRYEPLRRQMSESDDDAIAASVPAWQGMLERLGLALPPGVSVGDFAELVQGVIVGSLPAEGRRVRVASARRIAMVIKAVLVGVGSGDATLGAMSRPELETLAEFGDLIRAVVDGFPTDTDPARAVPDEPRDQLLAMMLLGLMDARDGRSLDQAVDDLQARRRSGPGDQAT